MRVLALVGCSLVASLAASVARADRGPEYAPSPYPYYPPAAYTAAPPPKRTWYGWETLATDGVAATMLFAAANAQGRGGEGLAYASLALYNLGAPTIHFAHGNYGRSLASLAVRSLPSILIFGEPRNAGGEALLVTVLSIPAMIAIDAAALAREDEEPAPPAATVYPTASATRNGGLVGLTGWF